MTLLDAVARATGLDHAKAEVATGAILGAIRLSAPKGTFDPVERAIPEAQQLILSAGTVIGGGRTGEIVALVSELRTNAGVLKLAGQLGRAGLTPTQVGQAAKALIGYVAEREGDEALRPLLDAMPGFMELVR
jgi:hypothetical protein